MSVNQGFSILLTHELTIEDIYLNTVDGLDLKKNDSLIQFIDTQSLSKVFDMIKDVNNDLIVYNESISFKGINMQVSINILYAKNNYILIGKPEEESKDGLIQELVRINNIQMNRIRELSENRKGKIFDQTAYDELSIVNNELVNMQRELNIKVFELEKLNIKFRRLGLVDYLTDLPNRRSFFDDVYKLLLHDQYNLIMLDLNNFKIINDTMGHDKGDEVLIIFANLLQKFSPVQARLYRLGGDEFAILNPYKNVINMEQIITAIENELHNIHKKLGVAYGKIRVGKEDITDDKQIEAAMHKADKLMYQHKAKTKGVQ